MGGRVWASGLMIWAPGDPDFKMLADRFVDEGQGRNAAEPLQSIRELPTLLSRYKNLAQITFATHGLPAAIVLPKGNAGLSEYPWFHAPHDELFRDEGRVLFWGCNIAQGAAGLLYLELVGRLLLRGRTGMVMASDALNFTFASLPIEPVMAPFGNLHMIYFDRDGKVLVRQRAYNG